VGEALLKDVRYKVYKSFGIGDDLYSLGMILLSILLVNDRNDLSSIAGLLAREKSETDRIKVKLSLLDDPAKQAERWLSEHPVRLDKSNIFHHFADRTQGRPSSIPDHLWQQLIAIGFRLTTGPGANMEGAAATLQLDHLRSELEVILRRLHGILFTRQANHLEIQSVIAQLLAEERAPG
jgi:hypothetical protein